MPSKGQQEDRSLARAAVIIGVNTYDHFPTLDLAESDAQRMYKHLIEQGWDIDNTDLLLGKQATLDAVTKRIDELNDTRYSDDAFLVFYFSGHGFLDKNGEGRLAFNDTVDTGSPKAPHGIEETKKGLAMKYIMDNLVLHDGVRANRVLVVLDCCAAGAIFTDANKGPKLEEPRIRWHTAHLVGRDHIESLFDNMNRMRAVLAACRKQESAYQVTGQFTNRVIEGWSGRAKEAISNAGNNVTINSLQDYLVQVDPHPLQHPGLYQSHFGTFILADTDQLVSARSQHHIQTRNEVQIGDGSYASNEDYLLGEFIPIPAGPFEMGSSATEVTAFTPLGGEDEYSAATGYQRHRVPVSAFEIARFPVSVAEYARFVQHHHDHTPKNWDDQEPNPSYPVIGVSWFDAKAYCDWLSETAGHTYRLPTEAEWEKASRWDQVTKKSRLYVWADTWDTRKCKASAEASKSQLLPLGGYRSYASAYGVEDIGGYISEWTSSAYAPYPFDEKRTEIEQATQRVRKGCTWRAASVRFSARPAYRVPADPSEQSNDVGFRLARSPE